MLLKLGSHKVQHHLQNIKEAYICLLLNLPFFFFFPPFTPIASFINHLQCLLWEKTTEDNNSTL